MDQMIPSIWAPGWFGILFPRMAALPRWSRMLILLHRWEVASPSSWPVWRARAAPSFFTSLLASGCHPPKVSTTIGKKAIPCLLHSSPAPFIFHSLPHQAGMELLDFHARVWKSDQGGQNSMQEMHGNQTKCMEFQPIKKSSNF